MSTREKAAAPADAISEPQNARSRRTRAALLAAARSVLEEAGFEALTMAAVAGRAGVTRRTVYLHLGSRSELVTALFDHVAEEEGLRQSLAQVWDAPDAAAGLDEWARHVARYHPRIVAVARAAERVQHVDPDAAAHRDRVRRAQLDSCRRLARWLERDGLLASAWTPDAAADMLWALLSTDMVEGLLVERRWSTRRLARHLCLLYRATFIDA